MGFGSLALATCMVLAPAAAALAQSGSDPVDNSRLRVGSAAFGDWHADAPLVRRRITVDDLPKPFATRSSNNFPRIVAWRAASPKVPPGFQAELFASDLKDPRALVLAPNGDVFVAESEPGRIRVLRPATARPNRGKTGSSRRA
jgi:glucose/arabinose dehydrogenase